MLKSHAHEPQGSRSNPIMNYHAVKSIVDLLALPAPSFVQESFLMLLGRVPSITEQRDREITLVLGCGRIAMLADIYQAPEAVSYRHAQMRDGSEADFIEQLYLRYLGRSPDPAGLEHYVNLSQRKGRAAAQADIAVSKEALYYNSMPFELERLVVLYRRSRQGWRWIGRAKRVEQIKNIESEIAANCIVRMRVLEQKNLSETLDAIALRDLQANSEQRVKDPKADDMLSASAIHTVDSSYLGTYAQQILRRIQILDSNGV